MCGITSTEKSQRFIYAILMLIILHLSGIVAAYGLPLFSVI